jgi:hypothetical protein
MMLPAEVLAELDRLSNAAAAKFERLRELALARPDPDLHAAFIDFQAAFGTVIDFTLELGKRTIPPTKES